MNVLDLTKELREVMDSFPTEYKPIDEEFLKNHEVEIESLKEIFSGKGGIHIVSVGEYDVICRIPAKEHFQSIMKNSGKKDSFDVDRELLAYCILYPKIDVINDWVREGKFGIVSSIVKKLLELGLVNAEATTKKL